MISLSPEVAYALRHGQAVVALESTIIAHGMPYPQNVQTAAALENAVRDAGAVPATCAVIDGELWAGLHPGQIEMLGRQGAQIAKASRRDLPYLLAQKRHGATTVASTMIIAHKAGIRIFATGGIGGVHRGAAQTMDISADLQELARTPVAVVSAGAKSILDLKLTLEYLETYGVPVLGYQTEEFPAFFTRKSGLKVDFRLDTAQEIADLLQAKWSTLDLGGGVLIANPIPEADQLDPEVIEQTIQKATRAAEQAGIGGKQLTPFLLSRIEQLSGGSSLEANIKLVLNNARLASEIAVALAQLD